MRKDKRAFCCVLLFVFPYPSGPVQVVSKVGAVMPLKGISAPNSDAGLPSTEGGNGSNMHWLSAEGMKRDRCVSFLSAEEQI